MYTGYNENNMSSGYWNNRTGRKNRISTKTYRGFWLTIGNTKMFIITYMYE